MQHKVAFEMAPHKKIKGRYVFNVIFLDTGEIRQKSRTEDWVMRRIFQSELRTWLQRYDEEIVIEEARR